MLDKPPDNKQASLSKTGEARPLYNIPRNKFRVT